MSIFPTFPSREISGTVISRQGTGRYADRFEKRRDPRDRPYYWPGGDPQVFDDDPEVDGAALQGNFISITPIKCDMTDYDALERLRRWRWDTALGISRIASRLRRAQAV